MTKIENVTKLFAAKRDKTGWTNLTEQTLTRDTELVYFESLEALESEGYTCVGLLFEVRDEELYTGSYNVTFINKGKRYLVIPKATEKSVGKRKSKTIKLF